MDAVARSPTGRNEDSHQKKSKGSLVSCIAVIHGIKERK